jgi:MFS family permease
MWRQLPFSKASAAFAVLRLELDSALLDRCFAVTLRRMDDASQRFGGLLDDSHIASAMRLANANAAVWAIGNGLISTLLVIYLAADLGAKGLAISLILAAPRFAGVLRLGVPAMMARLRARKTICIGAYVISSVILCGVPAVAVLQNRIDNAAGITLLVAAWCLYHLTEYVGTVALWSWLGDVTPAAVRGSLLGRREFWLVAGRIGGLVSSVTLASLWAWMLPKTPRWEPLSLSAAVGAAMMILAVVPLGRMPGLPHAPSATPRAPWRSLGRALVDPAYVRLLLFAFWFSIANGFTATVQELYPIRVLDIGYPVRQLLQGMMRAGQLTIAPWAGRMVDRFGNRPIMVVSQLIVATGPLFFLIASKDQPWLIAGAFLVWSAYAGLNVGLDNIKLKLAPADNNAPFIAIYHAVSDIANGVAIVAGGCIFDYIATKPAHLPTFYAQIFVLGWIARLLVVPLLARLIEPGARRLRDLISLGSD